MCIEKKSFKEMTPKEIKSTIWKVPLVKIIFWLSLGWVIIPLWIMYRITRAILGYWKCEDCERWFWVNDNKHTNSDHESYCNSCRIERIRRYEEQRSRMRPPVTKRPESQKGVREKNTGELVSQYRKE